MVVKKKKTTTEYFKNVFVKDNRGDKQKDNFTHKKYWSSSLTKGKVCVHRPKWKYEWGKKKCGVQSDEE